MNKLVGDAIYSLLEGFCPRVGNQIIEEHTPMPYIVYDLLSLGPTADVQTDLVLELNLWDNKGSDIEALDDLNDALLNRQTGLDKKIYRDDKTYLKFDLESSTSVPEADVALRRRLITFRVRYIDRRYE